VSKAQALPWVYVGDPSVPIYTDGVCSIPGLPEYGGPTAVGSSVKLAAGAIGDIGGRNGLPYINAAVLADSGASRRPKSWRS
jgi:hypothetical protein